MAKRRCETRSLNCWPSELLEDNCSLGDHVMSEALLSTDTESQLHARPQVWMLRLRAGKLPGAPDSF